VANLPSVKDVRLVNWPNSLGMRPVNEFHDKSKYAAQKKEMDRQAKNERHADAADLFVLLDT
jgi:hypothetical protein